MYSYQSDDVWSSSSYIDQTRRPTTLDVLERYMYRMMTSVPLRSSMVPVSLLDGVQTSETRSVTASSSCVASQSACLPQGAGYCLEEG
jgi:hypothetical protein